MLVVNKRPLSKLLERGYMQARPFRIRTCSFPHASPHHLYSHPTPPLITPCHTRMHTLPHPTVYTLIHLYSHPATPLFTPSHFFFHTLPHLYSHPATPIFKPCDTSIYILPHPYSHPDTHLFTPCRIPVYTLPHPYSHPLASARARLHAGVALSDPGPHPWEL